MKEDYLWDKTGGDAEIEKIENLLQVFRFEENAAPVIPAKVLPFVKKEMPPRRNFTFARAIAACIALASISMGVWILFSNAKSELAGEVNQKSIIDPKFVNKTETADENPSPAKPEIENKPKLQKAVYVERKSPKTDFLTAKTNLKNNRAGKSAAQKTKNPAEKPIRLTDEEQYAYDQLMLALSITGSKLKIVKETINGAENQSADIKTEK